MDVEAGAADHGLDDLASRSLLTTLFRRRTHRVSRGVKSVRAGSMSYESTAAPVALSPLEEAVLIASIGRNGLTMPDRPFQDPRNDEPIMAKPNLTMLGRTAGSPDNAQGTHFFMINDSGTYFLRSLPPVETASVTNAAALLDRASQSKVQVLDHRVDVTDGNRDFPAYLDSNRFLSNLPGTTIFLPIVDLSRQYVNALMYLLTQPDGARPTIVDDRNLYKSAGVAKWVKKGFLNKDIKVPLGALAQMRTQIEADLLLQNLFLVAEAMGLGAWIHATMSPPVLLGDPKFSERYGKMLGFDFVTPKWRFADVLRWHVPLPKYANLRAHPVGLTVNGEQLIKGTCPPYFPSMAEAVNDVIREKFGPNGTYQDPSVFAQIYKDDYGDRFLKDAPGYEDDVIGCAADICTYIYETHGRFPAHVDALHVPGVWLQVHHPDHDYYDRYFRDGLTDAHRSHDEHWH